MEIGDPKKAKVLLIVAVVMIAFAVFRLLPHPGPARHYQPLNDLAGGEALNMDSGSTTLLTDPFTHPDLVLALAPQGSTKDPSAGSVSTGRGSTPPSDMTAPARPGDSEISGLPGVGGWTEPDENTGQGQHSKGGTFVLSFDGVVGVNQLVAFVSWSGGSQQARRGTEVLGWTVSQLSAEQMVLVRGKDRKVLKVGSKVSL